MNRYRIAIILLLGVAAGLVVLTLSPAKKTPAEAARLAADVPKGAEAARSGKAASAARPSREAAKSRQAAAAAADAGGRPQAGPAPAAAAAPEPRKGEPAEALTPRERAVANWESTVDRIVAETGVPAADQAKRVKEAFDSLDKQDQMDGIRRSLNLFQDEQFPALYDILFDKAEDPDVLDAIFSDALNRPEEIKNPLMKELVKDKEHQCFFESARILDVIGELSVTPAPTASP